MCLVLNNVKGKLIFIVVPCMLFQPLLYCSNSCTSLHFKILISHTKTLKIRPYVFRSSLKPSSGDPWPYYARLLNWNVDLHLLKRVSVYGCMSIHSVCVCVFVGTYMSRPDRYAHTNRRNELTYSHITTVFITNVNQHSNSVT